MIQNNETYRKCRKLLDLAKEKKRESFEEICKSVFDEELIVRRDAIIALGISGDSRSYFILAGLFLNREIFNDSEFEIKKSIIYSLMANKDLRGRELLQSVSQEPNLKKLANRALKKLGTRSLDYSFLGNEDDRIKGRENLGRIVATIEDLRELEKYLNENEFTHPQTYIVDSLGRLKLGFELQEHVQVASGEKVLTAGEMFFSYGMGPLNLEMINNRSNSYFPHESTVKLALERLKEIGLNVKGTQIETFPKEGWLNQEWLAVHTATIFQMLGSEYHHWYQRMFPEK